MSKLAILRPQGNPPPIYRYFNAPLIRAEAQRAAWLDYRIHVRKFEADRTLDNEIEAVTARDAWDLAWRAANPA